MLVLLVTALVGDLILLPALLAGPLGRWFRPRHPQPTPTSDTIDLPHSQDNRTAEAIRNVRNHGDSVLSSHPSQVGPPAPRGTEHANQERSKKGRNS